MDDGLIWVFIYGSRDVVFFISLHERGRGRLQSVIVGGGFHPSLMTYGGGWHLLLSRVHMTWGWELFDTALSAVYFLFA